MNTAPIGNGPLPHAGLLADYVPDSLTLTAGTLVGDVTDIQEWQDGNVLQLEEAAATPGQDLGFNFVGVISVRRVAVGMYYAGSITHYIEIQIWNYTKVAWEILWTFTSALGTNLRYSNIPSNQNGADYFDAAGNAKLRLLHPPGGNASHDSFIDYVALLP
jgi:hypothetical protein